jgi:hypothetical protein
VLTLRELQTPLNLIDCTALDHAELEQISHWKPRTAGELVFNYWGLKLQAAGHAFDLSSGGVPGKPQCRRVSRAQAWLARVRGDDLVDGGKRRHGCADGRGEQAPEQLPHLAASHATRSRHTRR